MDLIIDSGENLGFVRSSSAPLMKSRAKENVTIYIKNENNKESNDTLNEAIKSEELLMEKTESIKAPKEIRPNALKPNIQGDDIKKSLKVNKSTPTKQNSLSPGKDGITKGIQTKSFTTSRNKLLIFEEDVALMKISDSKETIICLQEKPITKKEDDCSLIPKDFKEKISDNTEINEEIKVGESSKLDKIVYNLNILDSKEYIQPLEEIKEGEAAIRWCSICDLIVSNAINNIIIN